MDAGWRGGVVRLNSDRNMSVPVITRIRRVLHHFGGRLAGINGIQYGLGSFEGMQFCW